MLGITDDTKLMLHFKGADGIYCFPDASDSLHCFGFTGTAQVDTAVKKWSTGSLKVDGTNDSIYTTDSADWDIFASNLTDRTIDFWARHAAVDAAGTYITHIQDASNRWLFYYDPAVNLGVSLVVLVGGGGVIALNAGARLAAINTFYHVALCKVADKYGLYIDGIQKGYVQDTSEADFTGNLYLADDSYQSGQELEGYMDEARIHNANYFEADPQADLSDTITVPTEEYARAVVAAGAPPGIHLSRRLSL